MYPICFRALTLNLTSEPVIPISKSNLSVCTIPSQTISYGSGPYFSLSSPPVRPILPALVLSLPRLASMIGLTQTSCSDEFSLDALRRYVVPAKKDVRRQLYPSDGRDGT